MEPERAQRVLSTGKPVKTYPKGRRCRVLGCDTILSIYNKADSCGPHKPAVPILIRAPRKKRFDG